MSLITSNYLILKLFEKENILLSIWVTGSLQSVKPINFVQLRALKVLPPQGSHEKLFNP